MTEARPTSAELRAKIVREQVLPMARHLFEREPRAESVLFLVGQFWSDEADDAVHGELLACIDRDPRWPECARFAVNPLGKLEDDDVFDADDGYVPTDDAFWAQYRLLDGLPKSIRYFDDNGEMIVAFAAYCLEGCDQEQTKDESFTPYCIVRRNTAEPEVIGRMLRPEWENRWDVVDAAEAAALEHDSPTAVAPASPQVNPKLWSMLATGLAVAWVLGYVFWVACLR